MKRVCVIVDGVNGLTNTQKGKIARICNREEELLFVINAYNPYFERSYFSEGFMCEAALKGFEREMEILESSIYEYFGKNNNRVRIKYSYGKDLLKSLEDCLSDNELVILATADMTNRHTVHIEVSKEMPNPVILMTSRGWPSCPLVSASIDPISKKDKDYNKDKAIIDNAQELASKLNGIARIVHSRFIPAQLRGFLNEIKSENDAAIMAFADNLGISSDNLEVANGNPEYSLVNYVEKNGVNLLVLGSTARSNSERKYLGSTAESIIRARPCDLLLIP